MTAFQIDSNTAYETAQKDFCIENNRNPELIWEDLDEVFQTSDDLDLNDQTETILKEVEYLTF